MKKQKNNTQNSQRFTVILQIDKWNVRIFYNKTPLFNDFVEPAITECWTADARVIYSDCPKYKVRDIIEFWSNVDYKYTVYNYYKDMKFKNPDEKHREKPYLSYDEYMRYLEEQSYRCVGSITDKQLLASLPKEIADRLAMSPQLCSCVELFIYKAPNNRHWLIKSMSFAPFIDLSNYIE